MAACPELGPLIVAAVPITALDDAELEVKSAQPDKDSAGESLIRAADTSSEGGDIGAQLSKRATIGIREAL